MEWSGRQGERKSRDESFFLFFFQDLALSLFFTFFCFLLFPPLLATPVSLPPFRFRTMAAGAPAIKAAVQFAKAGTAAKKASVVKEIAIGMSLGMVCGVAFKVCLLSSF